MLIRLQDPQRSHLPWVTPTLVLICAGLYLLLSLISPLWHRELLVHWGSIPHTLFQALDTAGWSIWLLTLSRLVTALFLHADALHLLGNLLFLLIFGLPCERHLGSSSFLFLFLFGGAMGNLAGALSLPQVMAPVIGCSGSVSAVMGAYLILLPRAPLGLILPLGLYFEFVRLPAALLILLWAMLQWLFSRHGADFGAIVWWTHLGGFAFGVFYALCVRLAGRQSHAH